MATNLSARLGLPCLSLPQAQAWMSSGGTVIHCDGELPEIRFLEPHSEQLIKVVCNPGAGDVDRRRREGPGRADLLLRVTRARSKPPPRILDATAGWGRDAMLLAAAGCQVVACERSPVVRCLLSAGLEHWTRSENPDDRVIANRLQIVGAQAVEFMQSILEGQLEDPGFDVIVLDPMHPPRGKSALVRKELRALQRLVGQDTDADALLVPALALARRRVVVKRPTHGDPLAGQAPSRQVVGNRVRFDIYDTAKHA